jgi:hypothetical protein
MPVYTALMARKSAKKKNTPGPAPERLKIEGDWESAVGRSLRVVKPAEGWPKPDPVPQRAPKTRKKKGPGGQPKP